MYPFADLSLARRLERTEGEANRAVVNARAVASPEVGASWCEVDGTLVMFDGHPSPLTQTFGLGLFSAPTPEQFATIERFFEDRGAPVDHETCPLADPATFAMLMDRGYRPLEHSNVVYRPAAGFEPDGLNPDVRVRRIEPGEADAWAQTAAEGWREFGFEAFMLSTGRVQASAEGAQCFLAELGGAPVAAGALFIVEGVALLAGASTVPAARRRGVQLALLAARLHVAASQGCDLTMMAAAPGSSSQRNAERHGFRVAYTRTKWRRE